MYDALCIKQNPPLSASKSYAWLRLILGKMCRQPNTRHSIL